MASWITLTDDELTVDKVEQALRPIRDDLWVAAACVDRILDDVEVQQTLLQIGIARTEGAVQRCKDALAFSSSPYDANRGENVLNRSFENSTTTRRTYNTLLTHLQGAPADAQLCNVRVVLLERLDRLNTFVEICKEVVKNKREEDDLEEDDPWADRTAVSQTMHEANSAAVPPISLSIFLTDDLLKSSCRLASLQLFGALRILFKRHAPSLWPYRLVVLESVPEYAHPSDYYNVLPAFDVLANLEPVFSFNGWRPEQDWTETPTVQAVIKECGVPYCLLSNCSIPPPEHQQLAEPLKADELSDWYKGRVDRVITATGLIDIALATIQHGASQAIPGLDELGEELSLLSRLVYDAPQRSDTDDDWTLTRWRSMEPSAIVRAYLTHSTPETLSRDIARLVMPYLFVLESRAERAGKADPQLPTRLLYEYILGAPLEMVLAILEASKPILPAPQRLVKDDEDIARLALACLYGSDSLDQWPMMSRIFECLPAWELSREPGNEDAADTTITSIGAFVTPSTTRSHCTPSDLLVFFKPLPLTSLSRALDILDVHLESGEILSRWNVPAPLRWFLQSNGDVNEQRAWANRMARRAGGLEDRLDTQEDWEWLLGDMLKLAGKGDNGLRGAFGLLSRDEVMEIFLSGLLSTGKFQFAQNLLRSPKSRLSLGPKEIEEICLSCSREFFDNSSSGNYKFGEMKLAYDCLDVPRPSDRLLQEKEFIEATSRISSFNVMSRPGILITPIEIRLTKDRLSLVSRVLSSNNDAFKHTEVILDLVYKLGFRGNAAAEVKTLAMLSDTALQGEDFIRAYELSERMVALVINLCSSTPSSFEDPEVREASEVSWVACFQLGRQPEFDDLDKKLSLIGHALELCPPEKLHDVLATWRRLEKADIKYREERLSRQQSGATASGSHKSIPSDVTSSLRARLQEFHLLAPPLLSTPDAAALATRTFRSVAANFPFSVGSRGQSQSSDQDECRSRGGSQRRTDGQDVSTQATRVFSKGIGWLIGADEDKY